MLIDSENEEVSLSSTMFKRMGSAISSFQDEAIPQILYNFSFPGVSSSSTSVFTVGAVDTAILVFSFVFTIYEERFHLYHLHLGNIDNIDSIGNIICLHVDQLDHFRPKEAFHKPVQSALSKQIELRQGVFSSLHIIEKDFTFAFHLSAPLRIGSIICLHVDQLGYSRPREANRTVNLVTM